MEHPENSREAVLEAVNSGADMIEVDIRLCSDGVPVLCHDKNLRRLFGRHGTLRDITSDQFRELLILGSGTPLTLEDFLTLDELTIPFILDIKEFGTERCVCSLLTERDAVQSTILSSFYSLVIRAYKREIPDLKTALILDRVATIPFSLGLISMSQPYLKFTQAEYLHLYYRHSNLRAARLLRERGYHIAFWTIDDKSEIIKAIEAEPYGIMTNTPARMIPELKSHRSV